MRRLRRMRSLFDCSPDPLASACALSTYLDLLLHWPKCADFALRRDPEEPRLGIDAPLALHEISLWLQLCTSRQILCTIRLPRHLNFDVNFDCGDGNSCAADYCDCCDVYSGDIFDSDRHVVTTTKNEIRRTSTTRRS